MTGTLDRLAGAAGIRPDYEDVWGTLHRVPDATKRALLAAMGLPAGNDAQAAESLERMEARRWTRPLPLVATFDEGGPTGIPVALESGCGRLLRWQLLAEDGGRREGEARFDVLPQIEAGCFAGRHYERRLLDLPAGIAAGYHRLVLDGPGGRAEARLIVAPPRCFTVEDAVGDERLWGLAVQVYGLRSDRNWGAGDFGDLTEAAERAAALGADLLGINPVHALFSADPNHYGPYAPSNRAFLNPLYLDIGDIPELARCPEAQALMAEEGFRARLHAARDSALVDYPALSSLKLPVLEALFRCFQASADGDRQREFHAFRAAMGTPLERHAQFEALHEHFFAGGSGPWFWRDWPAPYRNCGSAEVATFARERHERVSFFAWLQWLADMQLARAQRSACAAGMRLGLYRDLAVGVHAGGSAAWTLPETVLSGVSVGAPPDALGPEGQNWGVSPLSPEGLREAGYEPFIADLRANMRHAGALRIDHVMALERLFWIPQGMSGKDGAYVSYPFEDLLRIVALESRRNRCMVIGEDLGTVPEGFRPRLERAGVLSYRILMFERDGDGRFKQPADYPQQALAAPSTHDLPTLAGFWAGRDLDWRADISTALSAQDKAAAREERGRDKERLLDALRRSGDPIDDDAAPRADRLRDAVYRFLARSPAHLLMVQIEDLSGEIEQPNLPGTTDAHPNWRRKLSSATAAVFDDPAVRALGSAIREARER